MEIMCCLPVLMAHMLTGQRVHEWAGTLMFLMFIIHNVLNANWYLKLLRGKYTPQRMLQTVTNLLVFASMLGLMISGIIMSRHVFSFLSINGGMAFARKLHMLSSLLGIYSNVTSSWSSWEHD
jgi:integral membrane sensor domain MASE1